MSPKHPNVKVQLTGRDGNAFAIIGTVTQALKRAGVPTKEVKEYQSESMSGDYNNVLATAMRWVDVR